MIIYHAVLGIIERGGGFIPFITPVSANTDSLVFLAFIWGQGEHKSHH